MTDSSDYTPPKIWSADKQSGGAVREHQSSRLRRDA